MGPFRDSGVTQITPSLPAGNGQFQAIFPAWLRETSTFELHFGWAEGEGASCSRSGIVAVVCGIRSRAKPLCRFCFFSKMCIRTSNSWAGEEGNFRVFVCRNRQAPLRKGSVYATKLFSRFRGAPPLTVSRPMTEPMLRNRAAELPTDSCIEHYSNI